jgi:hypothetical protein
MSFEITKIRWFRPSATHSRRAASIQMSRGALKLNATIPPVSTM